MGSLVVNENQRKNKAVSTATKAYSYAFSVEIRSHYHRADTWTLVDLYQCIMVSTSLPSAEVDGELVADGKFQFISIHSPDDAKDRRTRRQARSHAVKQALSNKRKLQRESRENFLVLSSRDYAKSLVGKKARTQAL